LAPEQGLDEPADWTGSNYFNYFTEIEEHFRTARGTGLFLLSPLDWALIETWKSAGVPLEAVLRGIDTAFQKWRSRKQRSQAVNSLAYCAQAVLKEAEQIAGAATSQPRPEASAPFSLAELTAYLEENQRYLAQDRYAPYGEIATALAEVLASVATHFADLEDLERRLTALEEKMMAIARTKLTGEQLLLVRRDLDQQLRPYRSKMTADQLALVERQFLDRRILEDAGLRRLSLFYLGS
jgi:hypothetical protein